MRDEVGSAGARLEGQIGHGKRIDLLSDGGVKIERHVRADCAPSPEALVKQHRRFDTIGVGDRQDTTVTRRAFTAGDRKTDAPTVLTDYVKPIIPSLPIIPE